MKLVYRILAYVIAVEVVVQAMAAVYGMAGLDKWVAGGGVFDKAVLDSDGTPFPEVAGFMIHGMNGMTVIPVITLLLLISSFFAKLPGAVKWAVVVLVLVAVQMTLGLSAHSVPALGALHGLNALLLFTAALHTARRGRKASASPTIEPDERLATPV